MPGSTQPFVPRLSFRATAFVTLSVLAFVLVVIWMSVSAVRLFPQLGVKGSLLAYDFIQDRAEGVIGPEGGELNGQKGLRWEIPPAIFSELHMVTVSSVRPSPIFLSGELPRTQLRPLAVVTVDIKNDSREWSSWATPAAASQIATYDFQPNLVIPVTVSYRGLALLTELANYGDSGSLVAVDEAVAENGFVKFAPPTLLNEPVAHYRNVFVVYAAPNTVILRQQLQWADGQPVASSYVTGPYHSIISIADGQGNIALPVPNEGEAEVAVKSWQYEIKASFVRRSGQTGADGWEWLTESRDHPTEPVVEACDGIQSLLQRDRCYFNEAIRSRISNICLKLLQEEMHNPCLSTIAKSTRSVEDCRKIEGIGADGIPFQDACIYDIATTDRNMTACIYISDRNDALQEKCYLRVIGNDTSETACYTMPVSVTGARNDCVTAFAADRKLPELCEKEKTSDQMAHDLCLKRLANVMDDASLCERIIFKQYRVYKDCLAQF